MQYKVLSGFLSENLTHLQYRYVFLLKLAKLAKKHYA